MNTNTIDETDSTFKTEATTLDQLIIVLEISFIFLLVYSLIALFDSAFTGLGFYDGISKDYLGRKDVGSLEGGRWEVIVRVTLVFNLLLFAFSLIFGIWMRKTRDGWTWDKLGYTLRTPNYSFKNLAGRSLLLGLLCFVILYTIMMPIPVNHLMVKHYVPNIILV